MSKKQIIIDGVDVKDCKRRIGKDNYCRYYKRPCSENNFNCIWKKYLRKEQECEELKQWKKGAENLFKAQIDNPDKIINRYKQALDEIEKYLDAQQKYFDGEDYHNLLDIINKAKEQ